MNSFKQLICNLIFMSAILCPSAHATTGTIGWNTEGSNKTSNIQVLWVSKYGTTSTGATGGYVQYFYFWTAAADVGKQLKIGIYDAVSEGNLLYSATATGVTSNGWTAVDLRNQGIWLAPGTSYYPAICTSGSGHGYAWDGGFPTSGVNYNVVAGVYNASMADPGATTANYAGAGAPLRVSFYMTYEECPENIYLPDSNLTDHRIIPMDENDEGEIELSGFYQSTEPTHIEVELRSANPSGTLGYTTVGATHYSNIQVLWVSKEAVTTNSTGGELDKFYVYTDAADVGEEIKIGVYDAVSEGNLLYSATVAHGGSAGWTEFDLSSEHIALAPNTSYYPALCSPPSTSGYTCTQSAATSGVNFNAVAGVYAAAMLDPGAVTADYTGSGSPLKVSFYCTYKPSPVLVNGNYWNALSSETIADGAWTGTLTNIPAYDGFFYYDIRKSNVTATILSGDIPNSVGYLCAVAGQSPADFWFDWWPGTYTKKSSDTETRMYRYATTGQQNLNPSDSPAYTGWKTVKGSGAIAFANALHDALGVSVGLIDVGFAGSALLEVNKSASWGYWLGSSTAYNWYEDFVENINASEPLDRRKLNAFLWIQGHTDAHNGESQADYYDGLNTLSGMVQSDTNYSNIPFVIDLLPRSVGYTTDANWNPIRMAQIQACDTSDTDNIFVGANCVDQALYSDGLHFAETAQEVEAVRNAQSLLRAEGVTGYDYSRGLRNQYWKRVDADHCDVYLIHDGGTNYTGTDSYDVYVGGAWEAATESAQSATVVRLTHSSGTVTAVRCLSGANPTIASIIKDNTALTLPIEPMEDIPRYKSGQVILLQY